MSEGNDNPAPVLVAYDGSDCAKAAIEEVAAQLRQGREAIVLTVREPLEAIPFLGIGGEPLDQDAVEAVIADTESGAGKIAAEGAELARRAGLDARPLVATGDPVWRRIIKVAEEQGAGLIVLGSRGRSGLTYVLLGSVATAVAQHSKCSVLIAHRRAQRAGCASSTQPIAGVEA